jgi:hypothetical protein
LLNDIGEMLEMKEGQNISLGISTKDLNSYNHLNHDHDHHAERPFALLLINTGRIKGCRQQQRWWNRVILIDEHLIIHILARGLSSLAPYEVIFKLIEAFR